MTMQDARSSTEGRRRAYAPEVVVHVDANVLAGERDPADPDSVARCHLDGGPAVSRAVIERLACDARISLTTHAEDGRTVDLGRSSRRPSRRQPTALPRRDAGCAMPARRRTRFLHAHHVVFWSRGGPTSADNLLLLCGRHRRLLHEGAFSVEALGSQRFRFLDAQGEPIDYAPEWRGDRTRLVTLYAAPDGKHIDQDTVAGRWDGPGWIPTCSSPPASTYATWRPVEQPSGATLGHSTSRHDRVSAETSTRLASQRGHHSA
jgi:hypothetical protein